MYTQKVTTGSDEGLGTKETELENCLKGNKYALSLKPKLRKNFKAQ